MTYSSFDFTKENNPRILRARIRDLRERKIFSASEVEKERAQIEIEGIEDKIRFIEGILTKKESEWKTR